MKDIKVGVEKMTRNRRKMIEKTADSLLLSKHSIQFSALFLLLSGHIIQAISMTVQRGNATSIMGTLGPLRKLEDFFDIISPREEK